MKLIEAMKKVKDLQVKVDDLKSKIAMHCVDLDFETPYYGNDQKATVDGWLQSVHDILKEILELRIRIQKTNLGTPVTINLNGMPVTKTIAEWIHRRRDLAASEMDLWKRLTDRGLKEGTVTLTSNERKEVKIRRYYTPAQRDEMIERFRSEPSTIDATLEVVNAVTELYEA